jgi:SAM-dependent methyltransferase
MTIGKVCDVPISLQQKYWDDWNASVREEGVLEDSIRQGEIVHHWLSELGRKDMRILEAGCGTGWLSPHLTGFGQVTACDLSAKVLARAQSRAPDVTFVHGDFMSLDFGGESFDSVISLEVLSHVADQPAFIAKIAHHLRPGGHLMLATQNRFVLKYLNRVPRPEPGQLRRWVDYRELRALLEPEFEVLELFSVTPKFGRGLGVRQWLQSSKLSWPIRKLLRRRSYRPNTTSTQVLHLDRGRSAVARTPLEALGLGWTLMALARKRVGK